MSEGHSVSVRPLKREKEREVRRSRETEETYRLHRRVCETRLSRYLDDPRSLRLPDPEMVREARQSEGCVSDVREVYDREKQRKGGGEEGMRRLTCAERMNLDRFFALIQCSLPIMLSAERTHQL